MDTLRQAILADETLQRALAVETGIDPFLDRCTAIAGTFGLPLGREAIAASLDPPAPSPVLLPLPPRHAGLPPRQWLPGDLLIGQGEPSIEWLHFGDTPLTEAFYGQSLARARARPINRLMRIATPVAMLTDHPFEAAPDGFVFHMSHCGSTLVSQMLAAVPGALSVSEPSVLDSMLRFVLAGQLPREAICGVVAALTRDRDGATRHRFIKFNAWHALLLPLLQELFPATPWLFLYREPVEVLVSQTRMTGLELYPGALPPQLTGQEAVGLSEAEYLAWLLGRIADAAATALPAGGGLAVDYRQLPGAFEAAVLPHFGVAPDAGLRTQLAAIGQADVKRPRHRFAADSEAKQAGATAELHALAERFIVPAIGRLRAFG